MPQVRLEPWPFARKSNALTTVPSWPSSQFVMGHGQPYLDQAVGLTDELYNIYNNHKMTNIYIYNHVQCHVTDLSFSKWVYLCLSPRRFFQVWVIVNIEIGEMLVSILCNPYPSQILSTKQQCFHSHNDVYFIYFSKKKKKKKKKKKNPHTNCKVMFTLIILFVCCYVKHVQNNHWLVSWIILWKYMSHNYFAIR